MSKPTKPALSAFGIDWENVDLESPCGRELHIIDPLTFSALLLDVGCNLPDINREMNKINNDIRILSYANVAPPLIAKLRNELGTIDRMTNRVEVIIRTDFIPAAYALAEVATAGVILLLLYVKIDLLLEATIIFAVISSMLIGLLLLIRDMDNPFEIGGHTYADVDLETLVYLETYFDEQDAEIERLAAGKPLS